MKLIYECHSGQSEAFRPTAVRRRIWLGVKSNTNRAFRDPTLSRRALTTDYNQKILVVIIERASVHFSPISICQNVVANGD